MRHNYIEIKRGIQWYRTAFTQINSNMDSHYGTIGLTSNQTHQLEHYTAAISLSCVQCAVYNIHYTVYSVHCTLYCVQCTLCRMYCVNCTMYIVHVTMYTVHSIQCTQYNVQCTLYTV